MSNISQGVRKGTVNENMPFIYHSNGRSYIIKTEKEKKHTFYAFQIKQR
jgi:type I site-specific restriction endonuclease